VRFVEGSFGSGEGERGKDFPVSTDPRSAAADFRFESLNVCRVAALAALLSGDPGAIEGLATPLEEMGLPPAVTTGRQALGFADPAEVLDELEVADADRNRVDLWASTQEDPNPHSGVGFLLEMLGSPLERESAAAAAALWPLLKRDSEALRKVPISLSAMEREEGEVEPSRWDPGRWRSDYERLREEVGKPRRRASLRAIVERRLRQALRSPDPITVSLATAAGLPPGLLSPESLPVGEPWTESGSVTGDEVVSTMIHGTWGWKGNWWRPGGDFHRFVLDGLRPNLYARGTRFSWSGFYRESHRERACTDFLEWAEEIAPDGLQSVFGHSYGGEVAARAVTQGAAIAELVLLSAPVTDEVVAAVDQNIRVVDVRLRFDPVLALARTGQKLPVRPNVKTVRLKRWTLDHSATHDEQIWIEQSIAAQAGM
jgi:pimeloyl-ACP methyl ester carboxylesterase